ncbi:putative secreted protein [Wickerhamomyces ciferrii]|uniref:Secreted protein n=1 Tax=Wickerhamomyces ciferrii (strain ATCC 14091 / BCRC 22168 / CBS 111 / JCM 3599 / NBRC 0793 / NRRL Y-1031 F-60-10) TaxID=1206466 RepID=K0KZI5_WICCF|nr:uncharacterized protein BN7_6141 [Wickerhamomyces ciferrii]CCH46548.1 putative secreted protein [Wickerhamomyces ciferrii]
MKLSTVLVQGLLLSGIIASPVVTTAQDSLPDVVEDSNADNSTDSFTEEGYSPGSNYLCFDANKGKLCTGKSVASCEKHYESRGKDIANSLCSFYCSKVKNVNDCKTNKKKFNYHPPWGCDSAAYC